MGLFGELDANEVSDNPFYVAPDVYNCVLTEANRVEKKSGDGEGLSFKWVIEDEDSDYVGNSLSDWHNIYPDATEDDVTPQMRKDNARLKKRLKEMGLTPDEMNEILEDEHLDDLVGMQGLVEVSESADKKEPEKIYTNVKSVKRTDLEED